LSTSEPPRGAVLVAEVEGEPVAAIGLFDGHEVSDPARSNLAVRMRLHLVRIPLRLIVAIHGL
jgi:hypothetical protein